MYPEDRELEKIENWVISSTQDCMDLMDIVKSLWSYPNYFSMTYKSGVGKNPVFKFNLSTGGWSGNESIIGALQKNYMFWALTWFSSQRGGHYVFEVKHKPKHPYDRLDQEWENMDNEA